MLGSARSAGSLEVYVRPSLVAGGMFFAARFSVRRSFSVFCGCCFCDFFGFSERFAIVAS